MEPGEVSFRQSGVSRLMWGIPAVLELQFIDAEGKRPADLGISNDMLSGNVNFDFRCPACGLVVVIPRSPRA